MRLVIWKNREPWHIFCPLLLTVVFSIVSQSSSNIYGAPER